MRERGKEEGNEGMRNFVKKDEKEGRDKRDKRARN